MSQCKYVTNTTECIRLIIHIAMAAISIFFVRVKTFIAPSILCLIRMHSSGTNYKRSIAYYLKNATFPGKFKVQEALVITSVFITSDGI